MQILKITDNYNNDILLNERGVHMVDTFNIQVEKDLVNKYAENSLHILYKKHPNLCVTDKLAEDQYVDAPIELLEVLLLGMSVKAHTMGFLTTDPRTGQSYVQNPYIDRYEMAIKKALDAGIIQSTSNKRQDLRKKGFV